MSRLDQLTEIERDNYYIEFMQLEIAELTEFLTRFENIQDYFIKQKNPDREEWSIEVQGILKNIISMKTRVDKTT